MKTDRELLEQALEALNLINHRGNNDEELFKVGQTVTLIQERLAEDDDEPVAWMADDLNNENLYYDKQDAIDDGCAFIVPLYRRPQPKKRLTDEEIFDLENALPDEDMCSDRKWTLGLARAIERRINGEEE